MHFIFPTHIFTTRGRLYRFHKTCASKIGQESIMRRWQDTSWLSTYVSWSKGQISIHTNNFLSSQHFDDVCLIENRIKFWWRRNNGDIFVTNNKLCQHPSSTPKYFHGFGLSSDITQLKSFTFLVTVIDVSICDTCDDDSVPYSVTTFVTTFVLIMFDFNADSWLVLWFKMSWVLWISS